MYFKAWQYNVSCCKLWQYRTVKLFLPKYEVNEILHEGTEHEIQVCFTDKIIRDGFYFWKIEDLPEGIKPIKALSNGSIVTCYYKTDKEAVIYRPNPNAKEVYDPLETAEHIAHKKIYGTYWKENLKWIF